jgi:transcriptional regulator with XRE-family HTH domain
MTDIELGKNLKKARNNTHLTQAQVAEKVGIHVNFYARIERGETDASLETMKAILKALKIKSSEVFPF